MANDSILNCRRFGAASPREVEVILACQKTSHDCAMEVLAGCREHLNEDRAVAAAIVGIFSALCRVVAASVEPNIMATALATMMKSEVKTWQKQNQNQRT